jgi:AcrR family transcriptional regulator
MYSAVARHAGGGRDHGDSGRRGRPPDPALDEAIRRAALQVLEEVGFHRMTMDMIAGAAKVGKAAIYRRWRSKEDLLASLIEEDADASFAPPDTGSLRRDVELCLTAWTEILNGPSGRASRALLGLSAHEPAFAAADQRGPSARWAARLTDLLDRAAARGEISPAAEIALVVEAVSGIVLQRWLLASGPLDPALVRALVDELVIPMTTSSPPGASR